MSVSLTLCVDGELLSVAVDVSDSVDLDSDVGLHQSVFLQQVLHTQQVFPIILREQQHLQRQGAGSLKHLLTGGLQCPTVFDTLTGLLVDFTL